VHSGRTARSLDGLGVVGFPAGSRGQKGIPPRQRGSNSHTFISIAQRTDHLAKTDEQVKGGGELSCGSPFKGGAECLRCRARLDVGGTLQENSQWEKKIGLNRRPSRCRPRPGKCENSLTNPPKDLGQRDLRDEKENRRAKKRGDYAKNLLAEPMLGS